MCKVAYEFEESVFPKKNCRETSRELCLLYFILIQIQEAFRCCELTWCIELVGKPEKKM